MFLYLLPAPERRLFTVGITLDVVAHVEALERAWGAFDLDEALLVDGNARDIRRMERTLAFLLSPWRASQQPADGHTQFFDDAGLALARTQIRSIATLRGLRVHHRIGRPDGTISTDPTVRAGARAARAAERAARRAQRAAEARARLDARWAEYRTTDLPHVLDTLARTAQWLERARSVVVAQHEDIVATASHNAFGEPVLIVRGAEAAALRSEAETLTVALPYFGERMDGDQPIEISGSCRVVLSIGGSALASTPPPDEECELVLWLNPVALEILEGIPDLAGAAQAVRVAAATALAASGAPAATLRRFIPHPEPAAPTHSEDVNTPQ